MSDKKENTVEPPEGDDNPWDDDDGARTVATGAPIDLPSDIPSPITNPPPPMPQPAPPAAVPRLGGVGKKAGKQTMIGIAGPAPGAVAPPELKPAPPAGAPQVSPAPRPPAPGVPSSKGGMPVIPRAGAGPSSQRVPIGTPLAAKRPSVPDVPAPPSSDAYSDRQEDGPTMAVPSDAMGAHAIASMREEAKFRSPMAATGFAPGGMDALAFDNKPRQVKPQALAARPPSQPSHDEISEETTRAVARDELMRQQQDAHVVVGEDNDAIGDEATLAVPPGQLEFGPGGSNIAAALQATLEPKPPAFPPPQPVFPPPPGAPPMAAPHPMAHGQGQRPGSNPNVPVAQPMTGANAAPSSRGGQFPHSQPQPPYDPMMPGPPSFGGPPPQHGYPSSGHQQAMGPPSQNMLPMSGAGTHPMMGNHPGMGPNMGHGGGMMPMQGQNAPPPPWMTQPSPPPQGMQGTPSGFRITPQVIMLAVVGVVCLAIFVVGIVLFVQTKFN